MVERRPIVNGQRTTDNVGKRISELWVLNDRSFTCNRTQPPLPPPLSGQRANTCEPRRGIPRPDVSHGPGAGKAGWFASPQRRTAPTMCSTSSCTACEGGAASGAPCGRVSSLYERRAVEAAEAVAQDRKVQKAGWSGSGLPGRSLRFRAVGRAGCRRRSERLGARRC